MGQRNHKQDPTFAASKGLNWEMHKVQLQPSLVIIWELSHIPTKETSLGIGKFPK